MKRKKESRVQKVKQRNKHNRRRAKQDQKTNLQSDQLDQGSMKDTAM